MPVATPKQTTQYARQNPRNCTCVHQKILADCCMNIGCLVLHIGLTRYNAEPTCRYSSSQINVAIHVRLGDRNRQDLKQSDQYIDLLEDFMDTISSRVSSTGHDPPMFHIFSETQDPCPSPKNGVFKEFSRWPIDMQQVRIDMQQVQSYAKSGYYQPASMWQFR